MPAIGSSWAPHSWNNDAWAANTWINAQEAVIVEPIEPGSGVSSFPRRRPFLELPPNVRCEIYLDMAPMEFRADLLMAPADMRLSATALLPVTLKFTADAAMQPAEMRVQSLLQLKMIALSAQAK